MGSQKVRTVTSPANSYYVSKHRMLELQHFCLQYQDWKERRQQLYSEQERTSWRSNDTKQSNRNTENDPTGEIAVRIIFYGEKIELVENTAKDAGEDLWRYLLLGVTKGLSYPTLKSVYSIPCGKDAYYRCYRKFFYILDRRRG